MHSDTVWLVSCISARLSSPYVRQCETPWVTAEAWIRAHMWSPLGRSPKPECALISGGRGVQLRLARAQPWWFSHAASFVVSGDCVYLFTASVGSKPSSNWQLKYSLVDLGYGYSRQLRDEINVSQDKCQIGWGKQWTRSLKSRIPGYLDACMCPAPVSPSQEQGTRFSCLLHCLFQAASEMMQASSFVTHGVACQIVYITPFSTPKAKMES